MTEIEKKDKTLNGAPKRAQVPKACTNCRKMHAGCDTERPCKRCKQHGLESSCSDLPRKKRVSKKRKSDDEEVTKETKKKATEENTSVSVVPQTPVTLQTPSNDMPFKEFLTPQDTSVEAYNMMMTPSSYFNESISYPQTDQQYGLDYPDSKSPAPPLNTPKQNVPYTQTPNEVINGEIMFLVQQILELKENNKSLEKKLTGVTSELSDIKKSAQALVSTVQPTVAPKPTAITPLKASNDQAHQASNAPTVVSPWHTFQPQQELAVSVWKNTTFGKNVLVECNQKFVDLLGYPIEILQNDFSCSRLIRKDPADQTGPRDFPLKTQIVTATGVKSVFLTINPVSDKTAVKFFVLHILEAS